MKSDLPTYLPIVVMKILAAKRALRAASLYSTIASLARQRATGTCDLQQAELASWLNRSVPTIKRGERTLTACGLIEVEHHGRVNRRTIRPVPLSRLSRLVHNAASGIKTDPTVVSKMIPLPVAAPISSSSSRTLLQETGPAERAARDRMKASPVKEKLRGCTPADQRTLDRAIGELVERCHLWRQSWPEVRELVAQRAALEGVKRTLEHLTWVGAQTAGVKLSERGKRTLGLLRRTHGQLEEKRGARTHRAVRAGAG